MPGPVVRGLTSIITPASGVTKVDVDQFGRVIATHSLIASDIPSLDTSKITTGQLALARGGSGADLSATGAGFLRQVTTGAVVTVAALASGDIPNNAANTSGSAASLSAVLTAAAFPALTGDVTTTAGSLSTALSTVNSNVGTFALASVTVDGKGRITAVSAAATVGSGSVVLATSPTIVTPTIATLANLTTNGFIKTSGGNGTLGIDTSTYLTANQTITLSGVVTGSGTTAITTAFNSSTGSGAVVLATSPTITTPFVSDYTNANHAHTSAATGGSLDAAAIGSGTLNNARVNWAAPGTFGSTTRNSVAATTLSAAPVASTGTPTRALTVTAAAHTALTASTEFIDNLFDLSATIQFATGAITTQRAMRIQAPTYSFAASSTITTAATLSVSGAPIAGTNAVITRSYALNIESGDASVAGGLALGGYTSAVIGQGQIQAKLGSSGFIEFSIPGGQPGISLYDSTRVNSLRYDLIYDTTNNAFDLAANTLSNTKVVIGNRFVAASATLTVAGNVSLKHVVGGTSAPTIAAGTGAGGTPTVSVSNATDLSGIVNVLSGTLPVAASTVVTITFNVAYGQAPNVVLMPANAATALLSGATMVYLTSTTTTFVITAGATGLVAATQYSWTYICMQ